MRTLFLLLFLFSRCVSAQIVTATYILQSPVERTGKIQLVKCDSVVYLPTGFNNEKIKTPELIQGLKNRRIIRADLLYTANKSNPVFPQTELNKKRLAELYILFPRLFDNNLVDWHIIEQSAYKNQDEASEIFHGFRFICVNEKSEKNESDTENEISILEDWLKKTFPVKDSTIIIAEPERILTSDSIFYKSYSPDTRAYYPNNKVKKEKGITYSKKGIWNRSPVISEEERGDKIYSHHDKIKIHKHTEKNYNSKNFIFPDSVVSVVLRRNKHLDHPSTLLVEDVTGSMYPYIFQTFEWRRKYHSRINSFTFFNDGDRTPDAMKKTGATGGIYPIKTNQLQEVEECVKKAMRAGSGGDCPENNIEALLFAINRYPECDSIIMIVDNNAPVKDISLLPVLMKKEKPIHIILCGVTYGVNSDYLRIAMETKGSVHTIEKDVHFKRRLTEGTVLSIGTQKFILKSGKLELTR